MNKNKILLSLIGLFGGISPSIAQNNAQDNFKTTAKLESFCKIETQDINFGVVASPLTSQTAKGEMNVLCSKATNYQIDLAYGGKYGQGVGDNGNSYSVTKNSGFPGVQTYDIKENGVRVGGLNCYSDWTIIISYKRFADILGAPNGVRVYDNGTYGVCHNTSVISSSLSKLRVLDPYNYGVMTGTLAKDSLAYKVTIPDEPSKVWNKGINSYSSQGTGENQEIVMNAQIIVDKSSSKFLAQDTYLDTVIATINY